jgi:hypothetical protein
VSASSVQKRPVGTVVNRSSVSSIRARCAAATCSNYRRQTFAAIMRFNAVAPGRFSSRLMRVPVAIVAVETARRHQQGAVWDHLGKRMPYRFWRVLVLDAIGQALGDPEPLLDSRQLCGAAESSHTLA